MALKKKKKMSVTCGREVEGPLEAGEGVVVVVMVTVEPVVRHVHMVLLNISGLHPDVARKVRDPVKAEAGDEQSLPVHREHVRYFPRLMGAHSDVRVILRYQALGSSEDMCWNPFPI